VVSAANLNSPDQTVIAAMRERWPRDGSGQGRGRAPRRAAARQRALPLRAHEARQERLRADLDATDFRDLSRPLVNTGRRARFEPAPKPRGLYQQVPNPVRWWNPFATWRDGASGALSRWGPAAC